MALKPPRVLEREKHSPKHLPAKKKGFFRRFWWVFVPTPLAFMLAAFGALVRGLPADRAAGHAAADPDHATSTIARQPDRLAARRGRPHDRPARPDLAEPAARGDRHRGRGLLLPPGVDIKGIITRGVDRPGEARHGAGASTITAAAREERLRRPVHRERRRLHRLRRAAALDQGEDPRGAARRSSSKPNCARTRSWRST